MKFYLRSVINRAVQPGGTVPVETLASIRSNVPPGLIHSVWSDVILELWLEIGDTAYARDGYHGVINLIEKHLIPK